jgi:peroxidase
VQGYDYSVLLDLIDGDKSERDTARNQSVHGFGAIEWTKTWMEAACPKTVSWVDILAIAVWDILVLMGGGSYPMLTGRRNSAGSL